MLSVNFVDEKKVIEKLFDIERFEFLRIPMIVAQNEIKTSPLNSISSSLMAAEFRSRLIGSPLIQMNLPPVRTTTSSTVASNLRKLSL